MSMMFKREHLRRWFSLYESTTLNDCSFIPKYFSLFCFQSPSWPL